MLVGSVALPLWITLKKNLSAVALLPTKAEWRRRCCLTVSGISCSKRSQRRRWAGFWVFSTCVKLFHRWKKHRTYIFGITRFRWNFNALNNRRTVTKQDGSVPELLWGGVCCLEVSHKCLCSVWMDDRRTTTGRWRSLLGPTMDAALWIWEKPGDAKAILM